MRILIASVFDPLPGDGSLLIRYPYVAQAIADRGHEVHYVSSAFFHGKKQFRDPDLPPFFLARALRPGQEKSEKVSVHLLPAKPYYQNISLARLRHHQHFAKQLSIFLGEQGRFDLIISAFPPIKANTVIRKYSNRTQTPWILDIQDAWPQAFWTKMGGEGLGKLLTFPLLSQVKKQVKAADALFAVSEDYGELFGRKAQSFPLGISEEAFPDKAVAFNKPEGHKALLFMGSSSRTPFVRKLIQHWHKAPHDVHLVLAGAADWMQGLSTKPQNRLWVFPDPVPSQQLLAACDIGLVTPDPALYSRLPFKVFGYLSEGLSLMSNIEGGELEQWIEGHGLGATFDNSLDDFWNKLKAIKPDKARVKAWADEVLAKGKVYEAYAEAALRVAEHAAIGKSLEP
jgi:hypothetical protein